MAAQGVSAVIAGDTGTKTSASMDPAMLGGMELLDQALGGAGAEGAQILKAGSRRSQAFRKSLRLNEGLLVDPGHAIPAPRSTPTVGRPGLNQRTFLNKRAAPTVLGSESPTGASSPGRGWTHLDIAAREAPRAGGGALPPVPPPKPSHAPEGVTSDFLPRHMPRSHAETVTGLSRMSSSVVVARPPAREAGAEDARTLRRRATTMVTRRGKKKKRGIAVPAEDFEGPDSVRKGPTESDESLVEKSASLLVVEGSSLLDIVDKLPDGDWRTFTLDAYGDPKKVEQIILVQKHVRRWLGKRQVARMKKQLKRRGEVMKEILFTERSYIKGVEALINLYVIPLEHQARENPGTAVLSLQDIHVIFSNVMPICNLNKELLREMEQRYETWDPRKSKIGDIFLQLAPFLKFYTQYCNDHEPAIQRVSELGRTRPKFVRFMENAKHHPESMNRNMLDLLITPVQRIPRYLLLLTDFTKNTFPWHPDFESLNAALKIVHEVADHVNKSFHLAEGMNKIIEIQRIVGGDYIHLVEPHRRFIRQGTLVKNGLNRQYFLFNDLVMWSQKLLAAAGYRYRGHSFLHTVWVNDVPDVPGGTRNAFQIVSNVKTYTVRAESRAEKRAWIEALESCIDALVDKDPSLKKKRAPVRARMKRYGGILRSRSATETAAATDGTTADESYARRASSRARARGGPEVPSPIAFVSSWKITRAMITNEDAEGMLTKQGVTFTSWRTRLFVLKDKFLYYFRERKPTAEPAGVIPLVGSSLGSAESITKRKFCFEIRTVTRTYYVYTKGEGQLDFWMRTLNEAIAAPENLNADGLELVLSHVHLGSPGVRHQAISMLRAFSRDAENARTLMERNGLQVIFNTLLCSEHEPTLVEAAGCVQNCVKLEVISTLVMQTRNFLDILVYRMSCRPLFGVIVDVLVNLTCEEGDIAAARRHFSPGSGMLNSMRLLVLLTRSSCSAHVREKALAELANLACDSFARGRIFESGALSVLVDNLEHGSSECQGHAARALGYLARNDKNRRKIGPEVLVLVIRLLGSDSLDVAEQAAFALKNMSIDDSHRQLIIDGIGLPPLISLVSSERESLVLEAVEALRYFALTDKGKEAILDAGGLPRLIELLKSQNPGIQERAARVLANLCYNRSIEENIRVLEGTDPLFRILKAHNIRDREREPLIEQVLRAISSVTRTDHINQDLMMEHGCIPQLVALLSSLNPSLVEQSLNVLLNVSQLEKGIKLISSSGGLAPLSAIISSKKHKWISRVVGLMTLKLMVAQDICVEEMTRLQEVPVLGDFLLSSKELTSTVQFICRRLCIEIPAGAPSFEEEIRKKEAEEEEHRRELERKAERDREKQGKTKKEREADKAPTAVLSVPSEVSPAAVDGTAEVGEGNVADEREPESSVPVSGDSQPVSSSALAPLRAPVALWVSPEKNRDSIMVVVAEWSWEAQEPDQVAIQAGDSIDVLLKEDGDWWYGEVERSGQRGYFPSAYVVRPQGAAEQR